MTIFYLKLIAISAMVVDHIGLYFFPEMFAFRIIGRISFPIFAWVISNGASHTHNIKLYLARLFLLACISQPFFYLVNISIDPSFDRLNVFFTLFIGLAIITWVSNTKNKFFWLVIIISGGILSNLIKSDYGFMGVLSIVSFYIFKNRKFYMILAQVFSYGVAYWFWVPFVQASGFYTGLLLYFVELLGLFSIFLIALYNGKQGYRAKYFFYLIYPMQYVIIYLFQKTILH